MIELDRGEPVQLVLAPITFVGGLKFAVQERYNQSLFLRVLSGPLQGIAVRPLPCNYYVFQ